MAVAVMRVAIVTGSTAIINLAVGTVAGMKFVPNIIVRTAGKRSGSTSVASAAAVFMLVTASITAGVVAGIANPSVGTASVGGGVGGVVAVNGGRTFPLVGIAGVGAVSADASGGAGSRPKAVIITIIIASTILIFGGSGIVAVRGEIG